MNIEELRRLQPASNGHVYTDISATADEESQMRQAFQNPFIVIGRVLPTPPEEIVHKCALAHGLPELQGCWGYDFQKHKFACLPDSRFGEPDKWPSHKLDVLRKT